MSDHRLEGIHMAPRPYRTLVFVLYQLSLVTGIALLPVALVADRAGLPLPVGRVVERLGRTYERTASGS